MIGSVTSVSQTAYARPTSSTTQANLTAASTTATDDATTLDLSPGAQLLASLPSFSLDPKVHMANAEKRLGELMRQMGIPPDTDIDINVSSSGQITVSGDNDKLAELQTMLNDGTEMDLRNSLIATQTCATIQRIAAATQETQAKVEANPADIEALWNQMLADAEGIKSQSVDFSFSGGSLTGTFSDGTAIAIA